MQRILLVEDEERIRRVYAESLRMEGFEIFEAGYAAEGYEILRKKEVDLVLLDIRLPAVSGSVLYDVIEMFHRKVPVIVFSVYLVDEQKRMIDKAADYYDKSSGVPVLIEKIRKILERKQGERMFESARSQEKEER